MQHVQQHEVQISQNAQQYTEMTPQHTVVSSGQELSVVAPSQQINALQAQIGSGGHIILTGADASQLSGKLLKTMKKNNALFLLCFNVKFSTFVL